MYSKKSPVTDSPSSEEFPAPTHPHHIVEWCRDGNSSSVRVSGADMSNIFRAYRGRLNLSYWSSENNQKVCDDAMELLDEIVIGPDCEPTVIISYVALIREVYSHACVNLKQMKISEEQRRRQMLEQWRQIERHFLKVRQPMNHCWPIGNETDLLTVYLSLALLYSLYKDVCDEEVIFACFEAAQRARCCGAYKLSKNQFAELQQYCNSIEDIFFLRNQRVANGRSRFIDEPLVDERSLRRVGGPPPEHAPYRRLPDGKAILAEYGKMTYNATTKLRKAIARARALEALKTVQNERIAKSDDNLPLVNTLCSTKLPQQLSEESAKSHDSVTEVVNSIVAQVAGGPMTEQKHGNATISAASMARTEPTTDGKSELGLISVNTVAPNQQLNKLLTSSSAASNRARQNNIRNGGILVETTTVTVETFETRTTCEEPIQKDTVRSERVMPLRPAGDRKVLVENYAEIRLSEEEPPSLKQGLFNLHAATVEARDAERALHKQTSVSSSSHLSPLLSQSYPSPFPHISPVEAAPHPSPLVPLSTSATSAAASTVVSSHHVEGTSASPTVSSGGPLSKTIDSLPPVSLSTQTSHLLTDSSVIASLLLSKPYHSPSTPPLIPSSHVQENTSPAPEIQSSSPVSSCSPTFLPSSQPHPELFAPSTVSAHRAESPSILSVTPSPVTTTSPVVALDVVPTPPPVSPTDSSVFPTASPSSSLSSPFAASSFPPETSSSCTACPPRPVFSAPVTPVTSEVVGASPSSALIKKQSSVVSTSLFNVLPIPCEETSLSSTQLPTSKTVTISAPLRPSVPPPPPPLPDLFVASVSSSSVATITTSAGEPPSPASIIPSSHPLMPESSGLPKARPSAPPPPPPSAVSLMPPPQSTSLSFTLPPPPPPLPLSLEDPSTTSPPSSPVLTSAIIAQPTNSVVLSGTVTSPLETSSSPTKPFRSLISARRPLHSPVSSTACVVSLHGSLSTDTDELMRNFHLTSEVLEKEHMTRRVSADNANLPLPDEQEEMCETFKKIKRTKVNADAEGSMKQTTNAEPVESIKKETERSESSSNVLTSVMNHSSASESRDQIASHRGLLALDAELETTPFKRDIEADIEESLDGKAEQEVQDKMLPSPKDTNLAMPSKLLNDHDVSANDEAIRDQQSSQSFPKKTTSLGDRLNDNECDTSFISELTTSWIAHKHNQYKPQRRPETASYNISVTPHDEPSHDASADYSILTDGGNLPCETLRAITTEKDQVEIGTQESIETQLPKAGNDDETIQMDYSTNDKANMISLEDHSLEQFDVENGGVSVTSKANSAVYRIPTYSIFQNRGDNLTTFDWESEDAEAVVKSQDQSVTSNNQIENYNLGIVTGIEKYEVNDNTAAIGETSFSDFVRSDYTRQHKSADQSLMGVQLYQSGAAGNFSLMEELKRSLKTDGNDLSMQFTSPVREHVKQFSETLEGSQENLDEEEFDNGQEEIGQSQAQPRNDSIKDEEYADDEKSLEVEDVSKKTLTGFIPMHEEIITARSTLRHVVDMPKQMSSDTIEAGFDATRPSKVSWVTRAGSIFDNPITSVVENSSTVQAEDDDDSMTTLMTFFDPRLEFDRRIKLKKNLKPTLDLPTIVKKTGGTEASRKSSSGLWCSQDVPQEDEPRKAGAKDDEKSGTHKRCTPSNATDADGYYDTVSC